MITQHMTIQDHPDNAFISGSVRFEVRDSETGRLKRVHEQKNKIVAANGFGVNLVMRQFGGNTALSIDLSKAKFGTGTAAVTGAETDLATPVATISRINSTVGVTDIVLEFFASDAELPDGTYHEFGVFTQETNIFTRVLINAPDGFEKSTNEDVIIKYTITITPS